MIYQVLADFVVLFHFVFIVFVILGGLLAFRYRWMPWVHLPTALWGAAIEFVGWICPLTPLELWLRRASGENGYSTGFIDHYIVPIVYPAELSREVQLVLGGLLVAFNVTVYAIFLFRRRGRVTKEWSAPG